MFFCYKMNVKTIFYEILILACPLSLFGTASAATDKVLCYYETWNSGTFAPEDIDVNICTHVNVAFMGLEDDGKLKPLEGINDDLLGRLGALKSKNPNLKLIFSVGGWNEGGTRFSNVAADATKKATMADSAVWYLQKYNFDGIDVDWEVPGQNGGVPADKQNFVDMLSVLKNKFAGNYLLTTAVASDPEAGEYDVAAISQVVDYINLMTYDYHAGSTEKTGENSPLYASSTDSDWEKSHANCDASVKNWMNKGAAAQKITLGLAFYGHGFTLADPDNHGVGAPATGTAEGGSYDRICALKDGWTEEWDDEQQVPYKFSGSHWIGYDNTRSIGAKVQYAKQHDLAGVMMWAVDQDDKDGSCGTKNALLQAIKDNL